MLKLPLLSFLSIILLGSCAVEPEKIEPTEAAAETVVPEVKTEKSDLPPLEAKTAIDPDVMYLLLAAELATQRQQYGLAYEAYMELTKRVKDPKFAEQAAKLALQIKDSRKTNDAVSAWMNQEPKNVTAKKVAALNALRGNDKKAAVKELSTLLAAEPENFQNALLELSSILQKEGKEKFVYDTLEALSAKTTSNKPVIYFVQSLLAMQMKNNAQAEKKIEQTLALQPDWEHPLLIQAQLAIMANDLNHAKTLLNSAILKHPNNATFKKLLAQTLIKTSEYEAAAQQYQALISQNPKDGENYIALALINLQLNRESNAETILKTLAEQADWTSPANFYLGKIEEKRGNTDAAIALFDKVNDANFSLEAGMSTINLLAKARKFDEVEKRLNLLLQKFPEQKLRITLMQASLYNQQNQAEKAFALLSSALLEMPEEKDLLYTRALIAEHLGKIDVMEADLKKILAKEPNNAEALNALGYTLLNDEKRYREAEKYLQKAIKLQPNEPAIMDSFGWLQFKLGNHAQAAKYLQAAYEKLNSGEIAAHLCEVLWTMNKKEDAQKFFDEAIKNAPDDADLLNFKKRFLE
ncbi:MAG: tetratricopeptide repeat protein [Methylococcales bacterium]|nr:tetratricopeptide repeat protein [Methylococcales bacterium]